MPDGNKRSHKLTQINSWKTRACLGLYGVLVQPVMKGLIRSMFMATLSTLQETVKNEKAIAVAHYWLIYFLTYFLFT